ncbi:MAG: TolC family protein [Flavisolibacter sp.]
MKKQALFLGCLLVAGAWAAAQQKYEMTVREAVDLAYKNVVELKNAQIDYQIQVAKNREILGQAYPQLNGSAGANYYMKLPVLLFPDATSTAVYQILKDEGVSGNNGPINKVPDPTLRQVSFQQPWNLNVGATLTQLLFQPDVFVGLQARQAALDYNQALIEQTKEKIKDSAYKRYYAILIAQKQLFFVNESLDRLRKLYHDDSLMYRNGFAEKLDLDKVQVQMNNLQTTQTTVENAVTISYAAMKYAMGISQKDTVILKDDLTVASLKEGVLDGSFAYEDRAEIKTLSYTRKLLDLDVKRNRLGYLPTVSAVGNYTINAMGQKFFTNPQTLWINSSFVGLNISVPLFDGGQRRSKIQEARLNVQKLDNTISNVKQAIDLEQVITREGLKNALLNLDIQERNLDLAQKVYNATKLKFEQGLGSSFEVLQADTDYQMAQSNYFNALYNATVSKISYQSSLGKLP